MPAILPILTDMSSTQDSQAEIAPSSIPLEAGGNLLETPNRLASANNVSLDIEAPNPIHAHVNFFASFVQSLDEILDEENGTSATEFAIESLHQAHVEESTFSLQNNEPINPEDKEYGERLFAQYEEDQRTAQQSAPRVVQVNNAKEILDRGVINGTTTPVKNVPNFNYSHSSTKVKRIEHTIPPDFNTDPNLWDTQEERALSAVHQQEVLSRHAAISSFFVWGVRYHPPEDLSQRYRTVQIPVAVGTSLKEVLRRITTGQIYSANIFDTASIAGYNTALVVFVTACGASELDLRSMSMSLAAPAIIVPTLTWPINDAMLRKISNGWTRCISIRGFGTQYELNEILNMLVPPGYGRDNALLVAHRGEDGTIHMQFYSIKAADCAYHEARKMCSGNATVNFEHDPCDPTEGITFNSLDVTPTSSFGSRPDRPLLHINIEASPIKVPDLKYTGAGNSWADEIEEDEQMALNNIHGAANLSSDLAPAIGHATLPTICDIQHVASSSSVNVMTAFKSQLQWNHGL